MEIHCKSKDKPFIILGCIIVVLLFLVAWSSKPEIFGEQLDINNACVCLELDDNRQPLHISNNIPYGSRQICLWFNYKSSRDGTHVDVTWYYGKDVVLDESMKLMDKEGTKAFYLRREEGTALPAGKYKVVLSTNNKIITEIPFAILKRK